MEIPGNLGNRENVEASFRSINDHLVREGSSELAPDLDEAIDNRLVNEHLDLLRERQEVAQHLKNGGGIDAKVLEERLDELDRQVADLRTSIAEALSGGGTDQARINEAMSVFSETAQTSEEHEAQTQALRKLGMISDEGKFIYPIGLFSTVTDQKWRDYLKAVLLQMDEYDRMINERGFGERPDNAAINALNLARDLAHNEVTADVMHDLGLEPTKDNFDKARRLVGKMRDSMMPNTGESAIALQGFHNRLKQEIEGSPEDEAA